MYNLDREIEVEVTIIGWGVMELKNELNRVTEKDENGDGGMLY